jgi:HupE/UreJ protein
VRRLVLAAAALVASAGRLHAHGRSVSYSQWTLEPGGASVEVRLSALDATLTGVDPWADLPTVARYVVMHVGASRAGATCVATEPHASPPDDGIVRVRFSVDCGGVQVEAIASRLFAEVAPTHLHFARVVGADGAVSERVLTADSPTWVLGGGASAGRPQVGASLRDYIRLGVDHIRTGYDHLSFVVALLLLASSLGEVARIVTAFTIAHSITLAAAVLGVVHPVAAAVEALIGFSIALVAAENGWVLGGRGRVMPWLVVLPLIATATFRPGQVGTAGLLGVTLFAGCHAALMRRSDRPAGLRALIAFGFGLIHGFGFAGVLAEVELPRVRLVPALLGFNLGVELGQLVVVVVGWSILVALDHAVAGARRRVAELGSAVVLALGLFWFVTRGWG